MAESVDWDEFVEVFVKAENQHVSNKAKLASCRERLVGLVTEREATIEDIKKYERVTGEYEYGIRRLFGELSKSKVFDKDEDSIKDESVGDPLKPATERTGKLSKDGLEATVNTTASGYMMPSSYIRHQLSKSKVHTHPPQHQASGQAHGNGIRCKFDPCTKNGCPFEHPVTTMPGANDMCFPEALKASFLGLETSPEECITSSESPVASATPAEAPVMKTSVKESATSPSLKTSAKSLLTAPLEGEKFEESKRDKTIKMAGKIPKMRDQMTEEEKIDADIVAIQKMGPAVFNHVYTIQELKDHRSEVHKPTSRLMPEGWSGKPKSWRPAAPAFGQASPRQADHPNEDNKPMHSASQSNKESSRVGSRFADAGIHHRFAGFAASPFDRFPFGASSSESRATSKAVKYADYLAGEPSNAKAEAEAKAKEEAEAKAKEEAATISG